MRIARIQNSNKINYKGTFHSNELLEKSLSMADNYELKRFSDNLTRMYAENDNKHFVLKEDEQYFLNVKTKELLLCDKKCGEYVQTIGQDYTYSKLNKETQNRFLHAIERINDFLENYYPQKKMTCVPREILLKSISKHLVK